MTRFTFRRLTLTTLVLLFAISAAAGCGNSRRGGGVRGPVADSGVQPPADGDVLDPDAGAEDSSVEEDSSVDTAVTRSCETGFLECDGECVDVDTDVDNCGACGSYCDEGSYCEGGDCVDPGPTCPSPRTTCGDACVDTRSNRDHCGGCDAGCEGDDACRDGYCVSTCVPSCAGATCGDDGCGGSCGSCAFDETCSGRICESIAPAGGGDTCTSADTITSSGTFIFADFDADHASPSCFSTEGMVDVAYVYTAPRSGDVTVTTSNSVDTDTILAVFDSPGCGSVDELACNDDNLAGGLGSSVTFYASAGTRYYFLVTSYYSPAPTDAVTITVGPAVP